MLRMPRSLPASAGFGIRHFATTCDRSGIVGLVHTGSLPGRAAGTIDGFDGLGVLRVLRKTRYGLFLLGSQGFAIVRTIIEPGRTNLSFIDFPLLIPLQHRIRPNVGEAVCSKNKKELDCPLFLISDQSSSFFWGVRRRPVGWRSDRPYDVHPRNHAMRAWQPAWCSPHQDRDPART